MDRRGDNGEAVTIATKARRVNAILAVALIAFFLVHASLGAALLHGALGDGLAVAAWVGIGMTAAHVVGSIVTTVFMLGDDRRPPSMRKKRHQLLKWVTGGAVVVLLPLHLTAGNLVGDLHDAAGVAISAMLLIALAAHTYTGVKSLTRDLHAPSSFRLPLRLGVIALSVAIGAAFIAAVV